MRSCNVRTTRMCSASSRLLDVAEHDRDRRAQAGAVGRLDDLDPAGDRQLVGRDALTHAVVEHLRRRARHRPDAAAFSRSKPRERLLAGQVIDLHRRVGVQVDVRRLVLGHAQPLVVGDHPVRVDARLHADLGRPERDRLAHTPAELLRVLVGVRRAPALAEAAEGAADRADVGDVDVAVDDERDGLRPDRRAARRPPGACPRSPRARLAEQRGQLVLRQRDPSRPRAIAAGTSPSGSGGHRGGPEPRRGMNDQ